MSFGQRFLHYVRYYQLVIVTVIRRKISRPASRHITFIELFHLGYYMLLYSTGQPGDKVMLKSPRQTFDQPLQLSFYYYMSLNSTDSTAALSVVKYSQLEVYDGELLTLKGDHGRRWNHAVVCIPAGTYHVVFIGTVGLTQLSDIGLDEVSVQQTASCDQQEPSSYSGHLITCT